MNKPYLDLQDSRLMELYQKGDEKAFDLIYSRNKDKVYSYLKKRLYGQNEDLIEDVFQNIFIKLHKSRHLYKSELPYNKWLYTICRTVLIDSLKTNKLQTLEFKDFHFEDQNQDHQYYFDIENEKLLTKKEKSAIRLRYFYDEDFEKISKKLDTTVINSRKLISRGLKKLKDKMLKKRGLYQ